MGIGSARGEDRAVQAAELAISSPLLEASIDGAHGVLISIQGGSDLGLQEINEAARLVHEAAHAEANIIFGTVIDDALGDEVRVTVIAAGFDGGNPQPRADMRGYGAPAAVQAPSAQRELGQASRAEEPAPLTSGMRALNRPVVPLDEPRETLPPVAPSHYATPASAQPVPHFINEQSARSAHEETPTQSQLEVPRIFDEEPTRRRPIDDLDVPDFLK